MLHQFLSNGVEVALKENHFSKMVAIQVWVGVGSLLEQEKEAGLSHLIEHMLFKGTSRRAVGEISKTVEASGGDINAYTTFDRTVYYLTLASQHADLAVDLLADAVFHSTFDREELTKEKEVVLEEIRRSVDSPASQVGRRIFETMYHGTPAARPIIGYESSVAGFNRDDVVRFHKHWYQPSNMAVIAVGDFDTTKMFARIEELFGAPAKPTERTQLPTMVQAPKGVEVCLLKKDFKQPRLEMAFRGPGLQHFDMPAIDLVAFSLGAGDAARLNRRLRDQEGVASSVGCSLYSPSFGGIFELSALPFQETYLAAVRSLAREFSRLKYQEPISEGELERARANLKADRVYQEESVSGQARVLGFGLTTSNKTLYEDTFAAAVNHITPGHTQMAVDRWFDENSVQIVGMVPQESTITEEQIKRAYEEGIEEGRSGSQRGKIFAVAEQEGSHAPTVVRLKNGSVLVYRQNPSLDLFTLVAATEGGLRGEIKASIGSQYAIAEMLGLASARFDYEAVLTRIEGAGALLQGFSGKDSFGFKAQCLSENLRDVMSIWADCFLNPVFPDEQWQRVLREVQEIIESEDDSPFHTGVRRLQEILFGDHPYSSPLYGNWQTFSSFEPKKLLSEYIKFRDGGPWVFGCVANLPVDEIHEALEHHLEGWQPSNKARRFPSADLTLAPLTGAETMLVKEREQTHLFIGYRGLRWADAQRPALDVMATILGGSGGRLFLKLRDQQSLAYTVMPVVSFGCHRGMLGAYIACSPEKVPVAKESLLRELHEISAVPPTAEELQRAKNYIIGSHESDLQRSESQAMTMALMEVYGFGHDDFLQYPLRVNKVSADDVKQVAEALIAKQEPIIVAVGPKD